MIGFRSRIRCARKGAPRSADLAHLVRESIIRLMTHSPSDLSFSWDADEPRIADVPNAVIVVLIVIDIPYAQGTIPM